MSTKVFIVGGAGYIGSHMAKLAHMDGHTVIVLDNLSTGHRDAVKYGKFEYCDIHNSERLKELFDLYKPDVVMHFAAFSIVSESVLDPYKYYNNNISGTLNLLKAMVDHECTKFIFSSTAAVYGDPQYIPIDENHVKKPINPYGKSKLMVEDILEDFDLAYGMKYVTFRYFNAAGHDVDGELSERHNPETHLLPLILQTSRGERDSISIFGSDYNTPDGTCIRDYIHVSDLCQAHLKGLEYLTRVKKNTTSRIYNLGNEKGYSVREVIESVKNITGKNFTVVNQKRRHGDPDTLVASCDKAKKELSVVFKYTELKDIIQTLV